MRVRPDVLATGGLLIVPLAALLIFGARDGPARTTSGSSQGPVPVLPAPARTAEPALPATPPRAKRPPKARPAQRPAAKAVPRDEDSSDGLWPDAERFDEDSSSGQAATLFYDKKYAEAILTAQSCLAREPDNEACKTTLIRSYIRSRSFREARKTLDKCLAANPEDVECLGHQMNLHIGRGKSEQALEVAGRLAELAPDSKWGRLAAAISQGAKNAQP